ncbi:hypothetical protein B0H11DRAFT_2419983 [Mycena galericulata]|nr:hypothetical protein B0H11DRAFT_2419983 [Mycena galericulata]
MPSQLPLLKHSSSDIPGFRLLPRFSSPLWHPPELTSTTPRHPPKQTAPKQPVPVFDFDSIRKNYLTMLSQKPTDPDNTAAADTATIAPGDLAGADPMQAIHDLLGNAPSFSRRSPPAKHRLVITASPEFQSLGDSFDPSSPLFDDAASPLFDDAPQTFDVDAYLTSPMETPYDDFATSPADDSPFSDFLTTPVLPSASDSDMLTGPLIEDVGYSDDMSLFGGLSAYPTYEVSAAPKLPPTTQLYTISPSTPALDAVDPNNTVFPPKSEPKSVAPSPAKVQSRRRTSATGTRKNLKPEALIPLDAPTQKRNYITPSSTSRKAVPAVFAQKKRLHSVAFSADGDEELGELSPTVSEAETIEYKRRQNTLAARKSRKRTSTLAVACAVARVVAVRRAVGGQACAFDLRPRMVQVVSTRFILFSVIGLFPFPTGAHSRRSPAHTRVRVLAICLCGAFSLTSPPSFASGHARR